jgi:hypothetical protein
VLGSRVPCPSAGGLPGKAYHGAASSSIGAGPREDAAPRRRPEAPLEVPDQALKLPDPPVKGRVTPLLGAVWHRGCLPGRFSGARSKSCSLGGERIACAWSSPQDRCAFGSCWTRILPPSRAPPIWLDAERTQPRAPARGPVSASGSTASGSRVAGARGPARGRVWTVGPQGSAGGAELGDRPGADV